MSRQYSGLGVSACVHRSSSEKSSKKTRGTSDQATEDCARLHQVRSILQETAAGRGLADGESRQHAADLTWLMEHAYARFETSGNINIRDEACMWREQRDRVLRAIVFGSS